MPRRDTLYIIVTIVLCSLVISFVGHTYGTRDGVYNRFHTLAVVLNEIQDKYVEEVDEDELLYGAIEGMMDKLDPHSVFLPPDVYKDFLEGMKGTFGGLGIEITVENNILTVVAPIEDTPAYRAGVLAGDRIVEIDGESTEGMNVQEAVKVLRGEPGTKVTITVNSTARKKPREITITRDIIKVESIKGYTRDEDDHWEYMLDEEAGIGYIRVTNFQAATVEEFVKAVDTLRAAGLKGLIIDLRFNPGGYLKSAIEMSDLFLSDGVIVSTRGRDPKLNPPPVRAREFGTYPDFDLVVLINQFSASASEIVAGAIQDNNRGVVVGQQSFGKGTVQSMIDLEGGKCAMKLTTAKYYLPSGRSIQRDKDGENGGVHPDIVVEISEDDVPMLLAHWRRLGRHVNSPVKGPELPEELQHDPDNPFVDIQLQRAISYLKDSALARKLEKKAEGEVAKKEDEKD